MKAPITALSARATTGVCGQRLWGDIDLCDLLPDNMSTTLDLKGCTLGLFAELPWLHRVSKNNYRIVQEII